MDQLLKDVRFWELPGNQGIFGREGGAKSGEFASGFNVLSGGTPTLETADYFLRGDIAIRRLGRVSERTARLTETAKGSVQV